MPLVSVTLKDRYDSDVQHRLRSALAGAPFDGIRFIDRLETKGAKLTRQDVWNDMGEMRRV